MTPLVALVRKELAVLFGSPMAWLTLASIGLVTALLFFDNLRIYNQILFLYATTTMGGFESDTVPAYVNLRDQVFLPVMETLALTLVGLVPLATTLLTPAQIVAGKLVATYAFVALALALSFVYPATSIVRSGLGLGHLLAVYVGLFALGIALASVGLACSAFATSQLVAAISAYAVAFVLYDFRWMAQFLPERAAERILNGVFAGRPQIDFCWPYTWVAKGFRLLPARARRVSRGRQRGGAGPRRARPAGGSATSLPARGVPARSRDRRQWTLAPHGVRRRAHAGQLREDARGRPHRVGARQPRAHSRVSRRKAAPRRGAVHQIPTQPRRG